MTEKVKVQKIKRSNKMEEKIQAAGQRALLKNLEDNPSPTTLRIWAERAGEKLATAVARIEELESTNTVPRTEYDALVAAKTAAESETQALRANMDTTMEAALADERRILKRSLADIEQREHNLKIKIEAATKKFESTGIKAVIETLQKMVQRGDRTVPDFFKCPCKHVLLWKTFWESDERVETFCRLAADAQFNETVAVHILHSPICVYDGWLPGREEMLSRSTPESREYATEFLKHKGWTDEEINDAVGLLVRKHAERDAQRPRPNIDYEFASRSNTLKRVAVEGTMPRDGGAIAEIPPAFLPDRYPYCQD